jgi:hypothetical protein
MHFFYGALAISALLGTGGFFIDKTGEGVESASNGLVKVAVAAGALYFIAKKTKVI